MSRKIIGRKYLELGDIVLEGDMYIRNKEYSSIPEKVETSWLMPRNTVRNIFGKNLSDFTPFRPIYKLKIG